MSPAGAPPARGRVSPSIPSTVLVIGHPKRSYPGGQIYVTRFSAYV
jgi:hypothetical protein